MGVQTAAIDSGTGVLVATPVSDKGAPRAVPVSGGAPAPPAPVAIRPGCIGYTIETLPDIPAPPCNTANIPRGTSTIAQFLKCLLAATQWKFVGRVITVWRVSPRLLPAKSPVEDVPRLMRKEGFLLDPSAQFEPRPVFVVLWNSGEVCVCRKRPDEEDATVSLACD